MKPTLETVSHVCAVAACAVVISVSSVQFLRTGPQRQQAARLVDVPSSGTADLVLSLGQLTLNSSNNASVAVLEFADVQCPFCARYARDTYPIIKNEFVDSGRIVYAFKSFPLESIHPLAFNAGEATLCAGRQGMFPGMRDRLFVHQRSLRMSDLLQHAKTLGLDMNAFERCMDRQTAAEIERDIAEGLQAGVAGTPTFFIGTVLPDHMVRVKKRISGAQPFAAFKQAIDELLMGL